MPAGPSLERCFEEGAEARAKGLDAADNPYGPETPEGKEWGAGFGATFDLDEEDDPLSNRLRKEDEVLDADPLATRRGDSRGI